MAVATIEGGETLQANAAANFAGANAQIKRAFPTVRHLTTKTGLWVKTPYGGGRTPEQQKQLQKQGLTNVPPASSAHVKYIAVDIDNQRAFRNISNSTFEAILKAWGWRETVPNHGEPWHWVNDNKQRVSSDPNPKYQVYFCTGWLNPATGKLQAKNAQGKKVAGYYYEAGNGAWRRTWLSAIGRYWGRKYGYSGGRDYDYIVSQKDAAVPR